MPRRQILRALPLTLLLIWVGAATSTPASAAPSTRTVWVDPVHGRDGRTGATAATALRTLTAAWQQIPASRTILRPYRILVRTGTIGATSAPNYWEHRWGTAQAPISIVSVDGPGRAQLPSINMFDVRHLTVDGVAIRSPFDPFHCERCSFIELRRSAFVGIGDQTRGVGPQEGVKLNQSDHIRIVDSYLAGATDNSLDMVAVQHAYIARNTIAHAVDWCAYAKGGSTDIAFEANDVHHCGTGGITFGQGTGLQFMQAPWNTYEAYGAWAVDNVLHDITGAALGVNGGFGVLLSHNTAYRTGTADHLLEVVFGERSCDGTGEDDTTCAAARASGAWGPSASGGDPTPIGDSQVSIVDNLLVNPAGVASQWAQFGVYAPRASGDSGGPATVVTDDRLVIRGNTIWNGPPELDLGLGGEQGCAETSPTCAPDLVRSLNAVNTVEPAIHVVAGVVPVPSGPIDAGSGAGQPLPAVDWSGVPGVPAVAMPTTIDVDRSGAPRGGAAANPGAYSGEPAVTRLVASGGATVRVRSGEPLQPGLVVLRGDWVEVRATVPAGRRFVAWTGACAGQAGTTCVLHTDTATMTVGVRSR